MAVTRYQQADILALLEIPIVDILSHLGFPDKHRGDMYYSPFRQESTPSFHINRRCNIWYDHGAAVVELRSDLGQHFIGHVLSGS